MQTALHSASTSHGGPLLVPLVHGTGATLPDAISPSAKLYSGSLSSARHTHRAPDEERQSLHCPCRKSSCATEG